MNYQCQIIFSELLYCASKSVKILITLPMAEGGLYTE